MSPSTFAITVYRDAFDRAPRGFTLSLPMLVERLTTFRPRPGLTDKRQLPAWSPARFVGGRRSEHAIEVSCMVLDYDDGLPVKEAVRPWEDWFHVVYTTWSHREGHPKFRIVLPLASPVPAVEWASAWNWAWERAERRSDLKCKDPSRTYFLPAVGSDAQPRLAFVSPKAPLLLIYSSPPVTTVFRPIRPLRVPARDVDRVARRRLATLPEVREAFANQLSSTIAGVPGHRRAENLFCPACGRPSAWFWIDLGGPMRRAACSHRNTCGWNGPLEALYGPGGGT